MLSSGRGSGAEVFVAGRAAGAQRAAITTAVDVVLNNDPTEFHAHDEHELLWHVAGSFRVETPVSSWSVTPGMGVWVAAGTIHRTVGPAGYHCGFALVETAVCPDLWARTAPVTVDPLLRSLLAHLATPAADRVRVEAETVVLDLLGSALATVAMQLPLPADERCRRIVEVLLSEPLHPWGLSDWATEVGGSARTLSRVLMAETGLTFAQWRGHARTRRALGLLDEGLPVAVVARRVGYASPSAFVNAFRRMTGLTPGVYAENGSLHREVLRSAS